MRINLQCPYAEKDTAKVLGAKWDAQQKTWFVVNPKDLKVFSRWIPQSWNYYTEGKKGKQPKQKKNRRSRNPVEGKTYAITGTTFKPLCHCTSPPWEDCEHTESLAHQAMDEMLFP